MEDGMRQLKIFYFLAFAMAVLFANYTFAVTPPTYTGAANLTQKLPDPTQKGIGTNVIPFYMYSIYLNTAGWSCDKCNGEKNQAATPLYPGNSALPPGNYRVYMSVVMTSLNIGRWVTVNNIRVFNPSNNSTLTSTGNIGTQSCDGCSPWSNSYSSSSSFSTATAITPYFAFDVYDSSHNETYWQFTGTVVFVPT
jgi:hypothetical protein